MCPNELSFLTHRQHGCPHRCRMLPFGRVPVILGKTIANLVRVGIVPALVCLQGCAVPEERIAIGGGTASCVGETAALKRVLARRAQTDHADFATLCGIVKRGVHPSDAYDDCVHDALVLLGDLSVAPCDSKEGAWRKAAFADAICSGVRNGDEPTTALIMEFLRERQELASAAMVERIIEIAEAGSGKKRVLAIGFLAHYLGFVQKGLKYSDDPSGEGSVAFPISTVHAYWRKSGDALVSGKQSQINDTRSGRYYRPYRATELFHLDCPADQIMLPPAR